MKFILASSNLHKKREFEKLLYPHKVEIVDSFNAIENGSTYKENAIIKLKALEKIIKKHGVKYSDDTVLFADDSGLSVDSLPSVLGLYTSRFMDGEKQDIKNKKVIELLEGEKNRNAHFTCALAYKKANENDIVCVEGYLYGTIATFLSGNGGFGYDPIFIPKNEEETLAYLGEKYKNLNSHRSNASKKMLLDLGLV